MSKWPLYRGGLNKECMVLLDKFHMVGVIVSLTSLDKKVDSCNDLSAIFDCYENFKTFAKLSLNLFLDLIGGHRIYYYYYCGSK